MESNYGSSGGLHVHASQAHPHQQPPHLSAAYVIECFRPGARDMAPGAMTTCVPGELHEANRHQHQASFGFLHRNGGDSGGRVGATGTAARAGTGAAGQQLGGDNECAECPGCTSRSTGEINAETPGAQQS